MPIPSITHIIPIIFLSESSSLKINDDTSVSIAILDAFAALIYQGFGAVAYHFCNARLNSVMNITTHRAERYAVRGSLKD